MVTKVRSPVWYEVLCILLLFVLVVVAFPLGEAGRKVVGSEGEWGWASRWIR